MSPGIFQRPRGKAVSINGDTVAVMGNYYMIRATSVKNLAAFDNATGALITTWLPNPSNTVKQMILDGTDLYVMGDFDTIAATSRTALARFNTSTKNLDSTFNPVISLDRAALYVHGTFDGFAGYSESGNRRFAGSFNLSDNNLTSWDSYTNASGGLNDIIVFQGNIYIAGQFTTVNNGAASRTAVASFSEATGTLNASTFGLTNAQ